MPKKDALTKCLCAAAEEFVIAPKALIFQDKKIRWCLSVCVSVDTFDKSNNPKAAMILANNFGVQTAIPLGETDVATSFFRTKFGIVPLQRRFWNFVKLQKVPKICAKILYPLGTLKIPRMVNVLFLVIFRHRKCKVPIPASVSTSARWVDVQKTKVPNG